MIATHLVDELGADVARVRLPAPPTFGQRFSLAGGTFVVVGAPQRVIVGATPYQIVAVDAPPQQIGDGDTCIVQVHLLPPAGATPPPAPPARPRDETIQVGTVRG